MPDDLVPPEKDAHFRYRPTRRHGNGYGRRATDEPQVTLGKKLLVILLALVNVAYVAGEVLLNTISNCGH
ncbi:hypothetical protein QIO74_gp3 [ssRNA phage Zoerhiza.4_3]|uniref:Uncharacterized protein n=2 Tax=Leviviricetes TaxID=2842243 RepID=A0A8S5KXY4_9VIRU|nr:hypothetical protein QIO74_gp3 [ssRNA phage Zoerhiza.4_3]QDH89176.1 MAG: hypothetical protein H4Rhizo43312_000003 [Leviviridae sp.]DAD50028.1 TPA_asm: hypothetical protein [ssRNA phage Zoerhiza.4_3]